MSKLPAGWNEITLGEVADFIMGQAPPGSACNKEGIGTPFVKAGEFTDQNKPVIREWTTQPLKEAKSTDVLICVVGATSGKINLGAECAIGRSVAAIRPLDALNQHYLYAFLATKVDELRRGVNGSAQGVISKDALDQIPLPLAPPAEQRRIVSKLDKLRARLTRASRELDCISKLIESYKLAILAKAFSGDLTGAWRTSRSEKYLVASDFVKTRQRVARTRMAESGLGRDEKSSQILTDDDLTSQLQVAADNNPLPDDWSWASLGQVFGIYVGATPSRKILKYWNGEIPWVSSGEVAFCTITKTHENITQSGLDGASTRVHPKGTVLLGMIGEGKTRGQAAILDTPACNNQNCVAIRVSEAHYSSKYVYWYLYFAYEKTRTAGAGNNQPALNKDRVQRLPIPLAPPDEAVAVADAIESAFSWLDKIAAEHAVAEHLLPKLDQAILSKAFRGELVPQDPNDEPASALLEQIRIERDTQSVPRRRSRAA